MSIKKLLSNNYFYYSFLAIFFSVVFYFAYMMSGCSTAQKEEPKHIGGTPPYYEGHDDQIEPNPNK